MRQKVTKSREATLLLVLRGPFEGITFELWEGDSLGKILGETSNAKTVFKIFSYGYEGGKFYVMWFFITTKKNF